MAEIDPCVPIEVRVDGQGGGALKHPVFVRPEATFYEARLQIVVQQVWRDPFVFLVQKDGKTSVLNTAQEALFRVTRGGMLLRACDGGGGGGGGGEPNKSDKGKAKKGAAGGKGGEGGDGPADGDGILKKGGGVKKQAKVTMAEEVGGDGENDSDGEKVDSHDSPVHGQTNSGSNKQQGKKGGSNTNTKSNPNSNPNSKKPAAAAAAGPPSLGWPTSHISQFFSDHQCHSRCQCRCLHPRSALMCNDPLRQWEAIADSLRDKLREENRTDRFHIIVGHENGEDVVRVYCDECDAERSVGPGQTLCQFYSNHLRSRNHWERELLNKMRA